MKTNNTIVNTEKLLAKKVFRQRQAVLNRFPLLFTLLGTFGLVATFYGFEGLIDRVDILADNPWLILATGIGILSFTGLLYKKLQ